MRYRLRPVCLCAALCAIASLAASPLHGQELRGQIAGVVRDTAGAPVVGASVFVEGPALMDARVVTTTAAGTYRVMSLPPGAYTVTVIIAGYDVFGRDGVRVTIAGATTMNVVLQREGAAPQVVAAEPASRIDRSSTSLGTTFGSAFLRDVPTARDLWSLLAFTPGVQMRSVDVGGNLTGKELPFAVYGVESAQRTIVEGLIVNTSRTTSDGFFDVGSFDEVRVRTAGDGVDVASPGGVLSIAVKSGSDAFHGDHWADFTSAALIDDGFLDEVRSEEGFLTLQPRGNTARRHDVNATFGGRIVRSKLWFFAAARQTQIDRTVADVAIEDESRQRNATGKWNWQVTPGNQLIGFYTWRGKAEPTFGVSWFRPVESSLSQQARSQLAKVQWNGVLSERVYVDVHGGTHTSRTLRGAYGHDDDSVAGVPAGRQSYFGVLSGGAQDYERAALERPQFAGTLTFWHDGFLGDHTIRVGAQGFTSRDERRRFVASDAYYLDDVYGPAYVLLYNTPNTATSEERNAAVHLHDSWALSSRVTMNIGVRANRYELGWPSQSYTPNNSSIFPAVSVPAATVLKRTVVAPQLGVAWDVTGRNSTVVKAFGGRSYLDPMTETIANFNPVGVTAHLYGFNDLNRNRLWDAGELGPLSARIGLPGFARLDPAMRVPYADEIAVDLERAVNERTSVRGGYRLKMLRDQDAEVDAARMGRYVLPVTVTDYGEDGYLSRDDHAIQLLEISGQPGFDIVRTTAGAAWGTPEFDATHHTIELVLSKRFADRWQMLASWDATWSRSFVAADTPDDPDVMAYLPQAFYSNPNQRRLGQVSTSAWNAKVAAQYASPFGGITIAPAYRLLSGNNWGRAITYRQVAIPAEAPWRRAPQVRILDVRVERSFTFGGQKLAPVVDIFNVLNAAPVLNFVNVHGSSYRQATNLLGPRTIRIGAAYSF